MSTLRLSCPVSLRTAGVRTGAEIPSGTQADRERERERERERKRERKRERQRERGWPGPGTPGPGSHARMQHSQFGFRLSVVF